MNTKQNNNPILILKEYVDIINQSIEELIMLESEMEKIQKRIREIKNSKWQKALNYFILKKHRKNIKTTPNRKNRYTMEFFENTKILARKDFIRYQKKKNIDIQQSNKPILILKEYVDIINQSIEELIMLESEMEKIQKKIREIKNPKWQKAHAYFRGAKHNKRIKAIPNRKNGYTIEFFENTKILNREEIQRVKTIKKIEEQEKNILTREIIEEIIDSIHQEERMRKIDVDDLKMISSNIYNSVKEYIMNK